MPPLKRILVIRLGALGDLVFCFHAFHEIRLAHPDADIALLVRPAFADFARSLPWFDRVIVDERPTCPVSWLKMRRSIAAFAPNRIYDLQGKKRQTILYALLGGPLGPEWSGAAPLCKFPRPWPPKPTMSFPDFMAAQLRAAGVPEAAPPDLNWLSAPIDRFSLPPSYVVLVPGCSPTAPHKRWPAKNYAQLSEKLREKNIACIVVGTKADADVLAEIKKTDPGVIDLGSKTSLFELAEIMRRSVGVIGNDTGPVHMAAATGTATLALFSGKSNLVWSRPPGNRVTVLQKENLADLSLAEVFTALDMFLQHGEGAGRERKSSP